MVPKPANSLPVGRFCPPNVVCGGSNNSGGLNGLHLMHVLQQLQFLDVPSLVGPKEFRRMGLCLAEAETKEWIGHHTPELYRSKSFFFFFLQIILGGCCVLYNHMTPVVTK